MDASMFSLRLSCSLLSLVTAVSCRGAEEVSSPHVEVSRLAGSWYSADADALRKELTSYLDESPVVTSGRVCALIVPHAGYRYSGRVAAEGYKQVVGRKFRRVVVMGPSHRVFLPGAASVPDADAYRTPLGEVRVDREFIAKLLRSPFIRQVPEAHAGEHSVEIQFPLLQTALPGVPVAPLVVGQLDRASAAGLATALRAQLDDDTLVVASSDFTHYGANFDYVPFTDNIAENIEKLDMGAYALIERKNAEGFADYCKSTGATVCGRDGITVLLSLLPADARVQRVRYDTSGRMTGDFKSSVSYLSAAVVGSWGGATAASSVGTGTATLTETEQKVLLRLARRTIEHFFEKGDIPATDALRIALTPSMRAVRGAFVTLKERGELRGCIGEIRPQRPLCEAVMAHAINAAVRDHRFSPVRREELDSLVIEISALTPPRKVGSYSDIVIGRDGMVLQKGGAGAVFLPQVAPEQHWTLEETLTHLSLKAGLGPDDWREGARFETFQAEVFSEEHP
jgi:hypothetical protein